MIAIISNIMSDYYMNEGEIINIDKKRDMIRIKFSNGRKEWFRKMDCGRKTSEGHLSLGWVSEEPKVDKESEE